MIESFITGPEYTGKFGTPGDVEFVRLLYRYVLLREPVTGEAEFHAGTIPALGRTGVARSLLNSPEFRNGTQERLHAFLLFATLLPREPSPAEPMFRKQQLEAGGDTALRGGIDVFLASPELQALIQ